MKILEIKNIIKKDIPLHYRNEYKGEAVLELSQVRKIVQPLEFTIERSAMGSVDIDIQVQGEVEYPLIPVIKELKSYISQMDRDGRLL